MTLAEQPSKDRLLPWIAAERGLRAVVLLAIGVVLLTHPHTDWAHEVSQLVQKLGLDPKGNWVQRILKDAARVNSSRSTLFGVVALGYAVLEGAEAYGLWHRRRWGEWLTVLATSLLLIPEVWELTKSTTPLKVGALVVNLAVVVYLLVRLGVIASPLERLRARRGRR
jgi:uncharacterized membrane protein (DUF2068 family)